MSVNLINADGSLRKIAGNSSRLVYGATAVRRGTLGTEEITVSANSTHTITITFSSALPQADYVCEIFNVDPKIIKDYGNKTTTGFTVTLYNPTDADVIVNCATAQYKAMCLYIVDQNSLNTINGDASTPGSTDYKIAQAIGELGNKDDGTPYENTKEYTDIQITKTLNEFVQNVTDDDTVNTFKELVDYVVQHAPEAAQMAADILTLQQAIAAINADSGTNSTTAKIENAIGELGNKEDGTPYATAKEYMDDKITTAIEDFTTKESDDNVINTFSEIVAYIAKLNGDSETTGSLAYIINQYIGELGTKEDGSEYADLKEYIDEKIAESGSDNEITFTMEDYNGGRVLVAHHTYDDGT